MKNLTRVAATAGLFLAVGCSSERPTDESADVVYTNGRIYTVDEAQPWAEAVAIKDGKFLVVGAKADVEAVTGATTEGIDLEGRFAMPGLIDAHAHPLGAAEGWANLRISDPTDAAAILEEVRAYAEANPDLPMIRGEAWNLGVFPNNSPRKELLDEIVPDRPVYLISQTGHSAWANSNALELAGITKDTPQTEKFIFDTDPETGEPSGTVREFAMGALGAVGVQQLRLHQPHPRRRSPDVDGGRQAPRGAGRHDGSTLPGLGLAHEPLPRLFSGGGRRAHGWMGEVRDREDLPEVREDLL
jgi:hypothetical protein